MANLSLIYAPNEIFKQVAQPVKEVDTEIQSIIDEMFNVLKLEKGVGLGANMVGILKRIIVINWAAGKTSLSMVNPEVTWYSEETQTFQEASLSFPGIEANITRPEKVKLSYLDYNNQKQEMEAGGFLATIIQHEIDYLDGKIFLDRLSKIKRDRLLKKMRKHLKFNPPHTYGKQCHY